MSERTIEAVLAEIEQDAGADTGARFGALVGDYFRQAAGAEGPVSRGVDAAAGVACFNEPLPTGGRPLAEVLARLERDVIAGSNRLSHPMYIGHQVSAPLPVAVWTDAVISALNNSVAVREMSPVITHVEDRVISWLCELVGFPLGSAGSAARVRPGGTLTSGGTEASFTGLLAARNAAVPDAWEGGAGPDAGVIVVGEHAHYAIGRAAGELGLGTRNALAVPSRGFRMDVAALEERLAALAAERRRVIAVVATAGSTATGSFDDLEAIAAACERYGVWLHVDGAHGASALLSARHRHRLKGIERARTVAWDPHKAMLLPLSAGALLARDESDLERAFAQQAPYLFHAGAGGRRWDQGLRSFACSRRGDALKVWVALQRHGADGIGLLYDHLCDMAMAFHELVVEHPDFEALHVPESNILCFRYAPANVAEDRLDELNWQLREAWNRSGKGWITTTVLEGRRVLRVTVMNPRTAAEHVSATMSGLAGLGQALR